MFEFVPPWLPKNCGFKQLITFMVFVYLFGIIREKGIVFAIELNEVGESQETICCDQSSDANQKQKQQRVCFCKSSEHFSRSLTTLEVNCVPGDETVWQKNSRKSCPEVLGSISLDDDVRDDVVAQDHGSDECYGEVVKVRCQQSKNDASASNVK